MSGALGSPKCPVPQVPRDARACPSLCPTEAFKVGVRDGHGVVWSFGASDLESFHCSLFNAWQSSRLSPLYPSCSFEPWPFSSVLKGRGLSQSLSPVPPLGSQLWRWGFPLFLPLCLVVLALSLSLVVQELLGQPSVLLQEELFYK